MKYYRFPENRMWKAAFVLFFFAMLCLARDTLTTSAVLGFYKGQFLMLGLLGAAGVVFLWVNRRNFREILLDPRVIVFGLCALTLMLPMVFKRDWQMMYLSILLCVLFGVFLSYFLTLREVAKLYVVIMAVLGIYSVIASYIFRILPDRGLLPVPVVYNQIGVNFYWFFPAFVPLGYSKNRNFGIFREPGVYQFFLILAMVLNHYTVDWKQEKKRWLCSGALAVTMLTTMAVGGIAEMGLLAVVLFFDKKLYREAFFRKKSTWIGVAVIAALTGAGAAYCIYTKNLLYWEVYGLVVSKFMNRELSVTERTASVFINLDLFLHNPILGANIADVLHAIENNTTSTTILLAITGIGGGAVHILGWLLLCWKKERKLWVNLGLCIVMFLSFNTQNLTADTFFWLFPTMAMVEWAGPKLQRRA